MQIKSWSDWLAVLGEEGFPLYGGPICDRCGKHGRELKKYHTRGPGGFSDLCDDCKKDWPPVHG